MQHHYCDILFAMKICLTIILTVCLAYKFQAQKIDSISFHLYTDSLKKGTHNYINVDGKLSNGKWMPLTSKEIIFTSSYGTFEGNELILPPEPITDSVTIKAVLKAKPWLSREVTIWIKKKPDDEKLPTAEEILKPSKSEKKKSKNKSPG